MIEQGIVMLVQNDPTVQSLCQHGGYYATLPKDPVYPTWCYNVLSSSADLTLGQQSVLVFERWQIDVYSSSGNDVLRLADAIDDVLDHYYGTLPDPDQTLVQGIFCSDITDFFDTAVRNYRRMLEYELHFRRRDVGTSRSARKVLK